MSLIYIICIYSLARTRSICEPTLKKLDKGFFNPNVVYILSPERLLYLLHKFFCKNPPLKTKVRQCINKLGRELGMALDRQYLAITRKKRLDVSMQGSCCEQVKIRWNHRNVVLVNFLQFL